MYPSGSGGDGDETISISDPRENQKPRASATLARESAVTVSLSHTRSIFLRIFGVSDSHFVLSWALLDISGGSTHIPLGHHAFTTPLCRGGCKSVFPPPAG